MDIRNFFLPILNTILAASRYKVEFVSLRRLALYDYVNFITFLDAFTII